MTTELEHLKRIRELLATGWAQRVMARDKNGGNTEYMDSDAASFCVLGAIWRARGDLELEPKQLIPTLWRVTAQMGITSISKWNDDPIRTQAEVLALVDRAIEIAEAEQ